MPTTRKKKTRSKAKTKHARKPRKASHLRKSTSVKRSHKVRRSPGSKEDVTYLYECTRPGCGYKIVRDEKAEPGQLRSDWKCPKCHHVEFRCLGKGDLPESFQVPTSTERIDFEGVKTSQLGSN